MNIRYSEQLPEK